MIRVSVVLLPVDVILAGVWRIIAAKEIHPKTYK